MKIISFPERIVGSTVTSLAVAMWLLACTSLNAAINPAEAKIPDKIFSIANYGAVGDGTTTATAAIEAAINACKAAGGGSVEMPRGVYLAGPFHLFSNVNLHLDEGAVLRMLPFDKYPGGTDDPESFISGADLHDVAISGKGTIDGQGAPWWPFAKTKGARRPRMIALSSCKRILIEGVTLMNSPMFHIAIGGADTSDVIVRGVTIRAPASTDPVLPSHNTDACDVSGRNILVENCDVSVGDDNFTCGGNTHDVLITHCTYGYGHGVSIGSYTRGEVSNITVTHCTFTNTECGIRIKTDRDRGGHVHDMHYSDLQMTNVNFPILIYAAYMAPERKYRDLTNISAATATAYPPAPVGKLTPFYSDFVFKDITATVVPGGRAGLIWGLPEAKATNIVLENVHITADKPFGIFNAEGVRLINCQITTPAGVKPIVTGNAEVSVSP
ncbi:MAG TPA: glycosyl hydrolase family 28 protein [Lacunisphaera sp.]|jgi:polygalacturonase